MKWIYKAPMCKRITSFWLIVILCFMSHIACSEPWFTGPIIAASGITIPRGHTNLEWYGYRTKNQGMYNRHWKLVHGPNSTNDQVNPLLSYGLSDWMDFQFSFPYAINHSQKKTNHHIGDVAALLGFQLWQQAHSNWQPNLRFTIQEIFPTGRFEELSATNAGSDGTGAGSYQSVFSLNFQHLLFMGFEHYLRTRLDLSYLLAQPVNIHGISTYGGIEATNGVIKPGHLRSIDFSGEFTLNQNWVAVMECYYFYRSGSNFRGNPGTRPNGTIAQIGYEDVQEYSLAPGIEYNFSSHYGILAGLWFAIKGKDAVKFESIVIAFNAYW